MVGLLVGGLMAAMLPGVASAANGPLGGCPAGGGWNLGQASGIIPTIGNGNFHDQNGDGWICYRWNKGQSKKALQPAATIKDNTNPLPD